jgi:hypothetical protein
LKFAHHFVIFVGNDVTVPGVIAKPIKVGSDRGDLARHGQDDVRSSSFLKAELFPNNHFTTTGGTTIEIRRLREVSLQAYASVLCIFVFQTDAVLREGVYWTETSSRIRIASKLDQVAAHYLEVDQMQVNWMLQTEKNKLVYINRPWLIQGLGL